ncbi:DNA polymerase Y family protein [Mesorhizobium marinum]|uniref:DNA polymerase Y family protein n=1 Tax=Mesorhizobium marinum TaxID=3228790 RepID=A0ABV3QZE7_9HYPH
MDEEAERLRLKVGMGIADARAMYPAIEIVAEDPAADRRLLEALADWCDRYTPLVAFDGTDGLFLDITGCAHLFGGEEALLDGILASFFEQGFRTRAGLAGTPGTAWAAAHFSLPGKTLEDGDERSFLEDLPLFVLRLEPKTIASLESVGLRTVGSVMAAPRAPLARRFGAMLLLRLDQALGEVEEAVSPRLPVPALSVERHLAEPIGLVEDIEQLIPKLATSLKQDFERRGEGARLFELLLFRVDGAVSRIAARASLPLREPVPVGRLFHERLAALGAALEPGYGFDLVRLSAFETAALDTPQADLDGKAAAADEDVALFSDRVRARLGRAAMLMPLLVDSHLPERAASLVPADGGPPERKAPAVPRENDDYPSRRAPERPLRLFSRPEPIDVPVTEIPEGPPLTFRWRRAMHRVARAEGPERIAPEWWLQPAAEAAADIAGDGGKDRRKAGRQAAEDAGTARLTRDYFRVEDADGRRYWLFREGLYGKTDAVPCWYLQGVSA